MSLPKEIVHRTKNIAQRKFFIYNFFFLGFLAIILTSYFLIHPSPAYAQSCTPSCSSGYFCSLGIECCRCVNGNGPGQVGPVTCCNPPGPGSGSCRTYDVLGCLPDSGPEPPPPTPPPAPTSGPPGPPIPIPPSTQGEPRPRPTPFPCDEFSPNIPLTRDYDITKPIRTDQEHHSLRPYQASPCNQEVTETALFCGNDLVLTDTLSVIKQFFLRIVPIPRWGHNYSYEGAPIGPSCFTDANCAIGSNCVNGVCSPPICRDNGNGTETCMFSIDRLKQIAVDLSRADLPIMGYTEPSVGNESRLKKVVNSNVQPDPETMLHPEKVNEYVSWYLNGVNERAEYPFLEYVEPNETGPEATAKRKQIASKIIDFSGPIKKLLSQSSQWRVRLGEVDDAVASRENDAGIRHDQVAGCIYRLFGINFGPPVPCYGSGLDELVKTRIRLSDWDPNSRRPPLEEDFQNQTFIDYLIAIRRWRGDSCVVFTVPSIVPLVGGKQFFLCVDSFLRPNYWSNLFTYIPFSSTENRIGEVEITGVSVQPAQPNAIVTNVQVLNQEPAQLFFSHMQESAELADVLQGTYVPRDEPRIGQIADVAPAVAPFCDLTQIRSNPGDDLFAGEIRADVSYTANISCTYVAEGSGLPGDPNNGNLCRHFTGADCTSAVPDNYECAENYGRFDCASGQQCARDCSPVATGYTCDIAFFEALCVPDNFSCTTEVVVGPGLPPLCPSGRRCGQGCTRDNDSLPSPLEQQCTVPFNISLPTITETPKADEIWARLVAGASSVFKRIFPKIGPDAPIASILDIPAATQVSYSGNVTVVAGAPGSQRPGAAAELYFPHIGGVHEYFLQCIQTALRPQGFAEVCESGEPPMPGSCESPGSLPNLSGGSGSCALCNTGPLSGLVPPLMAQILESAGQAYDTPASLILGILAAEGGLERYNWTDETVREASVCGGQVPNCTTYNVSSSGAIGPFQWIPFWFTSYADAVNVIDPSREGDPCNFLDATFAAAKKLKYERGGAVSYSPPSCDGITYNTAGNGRGISTSCSGWTKEDVATAVRQYVGACNPGYQSYVFSFFNPYGCP